MANKEDKSKKAKKAFNAAKKVLKQPASKKMSGDGKAAARYKKAVKSADKSDVKAAKKKVKKNPKKYKQ